MQSRVVGYPGIAKAEQYVLQQFQEIGLQDVRSEEFMVTVPIDKGASLKIVGEEKEMKVQRGDELVVKSVGSSVKLSLHETDDLVIKPAGGLVKTAKAWPTVS